MSNCGCENKSVVLGKGQVLDSVKIVEPSSNIESSALLGDDLFGPRNTILGAGLKYTGGTVATDQKVYGLSRRNNSDY